MKNLTILALPLLLVACTQPAEPEAPTAESAAVDYPASAIVDHVDTYHGKEVADPYRWLEDDVRESEDVSDWVGAQNDVTFEYLATIEERALIEKRLTELWDYERYGLPRKEGGRYFYSYNNGLQNQSVVYTQESLEEEAELLIDPNTWSDDGTVALASYSPSPDGQHVAYLVQDGGSDWRVGEVLNIESGEKLDDRLEWLKFTGLSWAGDGSGFYYSRYPATSEEEKFQSLNTNMKIYFHRVGTSQDEDEMVFATPENPEWGPRAQVTDDGNHMIITISVGTDSRYTVIYRDLTDPESDPVTFVEGFEYDYSLVGSIGDDLYFRTNNGAPKNRLIVIDAKNPEPENWREIIPEAEDVLDGVNLVGGRLIADYMQDAWSVIKIFDLEGNHVSDVNLPGIGTAFGFNGKADDSETFFGYVSFNTPNTVNRFDVETGEVTVFKAPEVDFEPDDYVVEQVFYDSKDGTRIPMFIAHHKDVVPDGNRPTLLYAYGGFNISLTPSYSVTRMAWMEMGGIFALANIRGGGEYGE
ncbi:MAG: prolyl oligopeptidase family serine peptidase, partial [Woeseiaceae bacterium]